jgi:hypothetical protein
MIFHFLSVLPDGRMNMPVRTVMYIKKRGSFGRASPAGHSPLRLEPLSSTTRPTTKSDGIP